MSENLLQQAIELIKAGRNGEARSLLQSLIKSDSRNVAAWLWYVDACQTQAERLKVLETCARLNPGHPQVEQALMALRPASPPFIPFDRGAQERAAEWDVPQPWDAPEDKKDPVRTWDPAPYEPPKESPPAWEYTPPPPPPSRTELPDRSYAWYEVWWEVLSYRSVEAFEDLLRDPKATAGRAYLWVGISGLISSLIAVMLQSSAISNLLNSPEFQELQGGSTLNFSAYLWAFMLCMVPMGAFFSVLNLMISGAIQNFLAGMFGGTGKYASTVYLLGAISAPLSIISTVISVIPIINCLAAGISIYSIMLNVRALMAAQQINSIKALGVILLPGLLVLFLLCIVAAIFAPSMGEILQQLQAIATPAY